MRRGRAVDEQREQHEAGGEHGNEALHFGRQRGCSVAASASTRVSAPRKPPQVIATL